MFQKDLNADLLPKEWIEIYMMSIFMKEDRRKWKTNRALEYYHRWEDYMEM